MLDIRIQLWLFRFILSCIAPALAQNNASPVVTSDVVCRPFGPCESCPDDALHEPFCQPFGNRRLMHCTSTNRIPYDSKTPPGHGIMRHSSDPPQGETPAWESCGRIVVQERADFWEFVACNVLFASIGLFLVYARSKKMQALQARNLAARIGLIRGGSG